jgi:hypothetical protein
VAIKCVVENCASHFHAECARMEQLFMGIDLDDNEYHYQIFCKLHTPMKLLRLYDMRQKSFKNELKRFSLEF